MTADPFDAAFLAGAVRARIDREAVRQAADRLADDLERMDALAARIRATVPNATVRRGAFTLLVELVSGAHARLARQTEGDWRLAIVETARDGDSGAAIHGVPSRSFDDAVCELARWLGRKVAG